MVWDRIIKEEDKFVFIDAYFQGPALGNIAKVNDNDSIDLDFTNQYLILVPDFYIARLFWGKVDYAFGKIYLKDCTLMSKNVKFVPKLENTDMIVINLYNHEAVRHPFHLVYESVVQTRDRRTYDFESKKLT